MSSSGELVPLFHEGDLRVDPFTVADVAELTRRAAIPLAEGAVPNRLASAITWTLSALVSAEKFHATLSSAEELEVFAEINRHARALLLALGYPPSCSSIPKIRSQRENALLSSMIGVSFELDTGKALASASGVVLDLVKITSEALKSPDPSRGAGRRPDTMMTVVFRALIPVWVASFAVPPSKFKKAGGSTPWASALLERAIVAVPTISAVRRAAELGDLAIAKRMQNAWDEWLLMNEEERWWADIWCPGGRPEGRTFPEWLDGIPIT